MKLGTKLKVNLISIEKCSKNTCTLNTQIEMTWD